MDRLQAALAQHEIEAFVDREHVEKGEEWWARIQQLITEADTVIFVLSPDSAASSICQDEVDFAEKLNKRFIPVVARELGDVRPPDALARLNFVFFVANFLVGATGEFDTALSELVRALDTDIKWVREHTRLGIIADRWQRRSRPGELLLRGSELTAAENWLTSRPKNAPEPTITQIALVAQSRQTQVRRQRLTVGVSLVAVVIALGLASLAYWQREIAIANEQQALRQQEIATEQRKLAEKNEALAREQEAVAKKNEALASERSQQIERAEAERIAGLAEEALDSDRPDRAAEFLSAIKVTPGRPSANNRRLGSALLRTANRLAQPAKSIVLPDNVFSLKLSPDKSILAAGLAGRDENKGTVFLLDLPTLAIRWRFRAFSDDVVSGLAFSPNGQLLAVAGGKMATVWNVSTGKKVFDLVGPPLRGFTKSVDFALRGKRIVVGTNQNFALVFDADNGRLLSKLNGSSFETRLERASNREHQGWAEDLLTAVQKSTFKILGASTEVKSSPNGRIVAVTGPANPDASVQLFNTADGTLLSELGGGTGSLLSSGLGYGSLLLFSPDGKRVFASPAQEALQVWNVEDGTLLNELPGKNTKSILPTEGGRAVITGHGDGNVLFRCIDGLAWTYALKAHDTEIKFLVANSFANVLVSGARSKNKSIVKVWRLPSEEAICSGRIKTETMRPFQVYSEGRLIQTVAIDPKNGFVYAAYQDGNVRSWPLGGSSEDIIAIKNEDYSTGMHDGRLLSHYDAAMFVRSCEDCSYQAFQLNGKKLFESDIMAIAPDSADGRPILFKAPDLFWYFGEAEPPEPDSSSRPDWSEMDIASVTNTGTRALLRAGVFSDEPTKMILVDTKSKKILGAFDFDGKRALDVALSNDGAKIFALYGKVGDGGSNAVLVMYSDDGQRLATQKLENANPEKLKLSPDGSRILLHQDLGSGEGIYWVQRVSAQGFIGNTDRYENGKSYAFSSKGAFFVGETDGDVWSRPQNGTPEKIIALDAGTQRIAVSSDGTLMAAAKTNGDVSLIDIVNRKTLREFSYSKRISTMRFEPELGRLLLCDETSTCRIIVTETGASLTFEPRHSFSDFTIVGDIRFSLDGSAVFLSDCGGCSYAAYYPGGKKFFQNEIKAIAPHGENGRAVLFRSPDQYWSFGDPELPDLSFQAEKADWAELEIAAVTPSGHRAVVTSDEYDDQPPKTLLLDPKEQKVLAKLDWRGRPATKVAISNDGKQIYVLFKLIARSTEESFLVIFGEDGSQIAERKIADTGLTELELSPDHSKLILYTLTGNHWLQRLASGRFDGEVEQNESWSSFAFSGQGDLFVGTSAGQVLRISEAGEPKELFGPGGKIAKLALTPESDFVAAANEDGVVEIYDNNAGILVARQTLSTVVTAMAFQPKSRRLLVCLKAGDCTFKKFASDPVAASRRFGEQNVVAKPGRSGER